MRRLLPLFVALRAASCLRPVPGVRVPRVVRRAPVALGAGSSEGLLPADDSSGVKHVLTRPSN